MIIPDPGPGGNRYDGPGWRKGWLAGKEGLSADSARQ